ncbi:hypothetical protein HPB48_026644 [Haemaphysalis longicornis]|uniref:CCHC-type domain-containing protein n=1 Tax=Haemaphysalis longicornis TaxID=44386 RepID=A0A9J6HAB6_HAELO|nr:hypothetical protein HPB48_026644 [Haemaphysalis longicornis]
MFVNEWNPTILYAKRIKSSKTVVLIFNGMKVIRYVILGNFLVQCLLFRRQHDVCYGCGKAGHRADVCINPIGNACKHCVAQRHRAEATHTRKSYSRSKRRRSFVWWRSPGNLGPNMAKEPCRPAARRTGEARLLKDPAMENKSGDNRTRADRAADASADKPPMDREEKQENLGSDHVILQTKKEAETANPGTRKYKIIDSDAFRKTRKDDKREVNTCTEFIRIIKDDVKAVTEEIEAPAEYEAMDNKFAHLLEAKKRAQKEVGNAEAQ